MIQEARIIIGRYSTAGPANHSRTIPGAVVVCANTGTFARNGAVVRVRPGAPRFALIALLGRQGHFISDAELVDLIFSDDPAGGPGSRAAALMMSEVKLAAIALGFRVEAHRGRGWLLEDAVARAA